MAGRRAGRPSTMEQCPQPPLCGPSRLLGTAFPGWPGASPAPASASQMLGYRCAPPHGFLSPSSWHPLPPSLSPLLALAAPGPQPASSCLRPTRQPVASCQCRQRPLCLCLVPLPVSWRTQTKDLAECFRPHPVSSHLADVLPHHTYPGIKPLQGSMQAPTPRPASSRVPGHQNFLPQGLRLCCRICLENSYLLTLLLLFVFRLLKRFQF